MMLINKQRVECYLITEKHADIQRLNFFFCTVISLIDMDIQNSCRKARDKF